MKEIIAKHPHQFEGFMNIDLFKKITELGEGKDTAILQFSQQHQIEYVGELAERWTERKIIKDEKDIVAMNLALAWVSSNSQFLYNQKEIYVENLKAYIKEHNLSTTTIITLMYFMGREKIIDKEFIEEFTQMDIQKSSFEHIFNIYFLTTLYGMYKDFEVLHEVICRYLDAMKLSLKNPFEDYTQLYLLSSTYLMLDKPKAQSFKTKGMSRLLQTIGNLRWKEVEWSNRSTAASVIGISSKDVITYNYILATKFKSSYEQKITGPGFERIHANLLRVHYTDKNDEFPHELVDDVKNLFEFHNSEDYYTPSPFGKMLKNHLSEVPDHNLIHLMSHVSDEEFIKKINPKYIRFVEDDLLDITKQKRVVESLLNYQTDQLKEDEFRYLEGKRTELDYSFSPFRQSYVTALIEYGFLDLEEIGFLKKNGYLENIISYIKQNKSTSEYLEYLEPLEPKYYSNLENLAELTKETEEIDNETKKRYFQLKLKDVFTNKPTKYADTLLIFLQNDEFLKLFDYTGAEVHELERQLYDNKMLSDKNHKELHKKLTPKEVLEVEYISVAKKEIANKFGESYPEHYIDKLINKCMIRPVLTETLFESILNFRISGSYGHSIKEYLFMIYQVKAHLSLTENQIAALENKALNYIIGETEAKSA